MNKHFKLTNKLSFIIILTVIISISVLGYYFDTFLKENDFQSTKKRMEHTHQRLYSDVLKINDELIKGVNFIKNDEHTIASIDLINNYQDKQNYNAILLDEEKKIIANELLDRVKLSLNDNIAIYDKNEELIAFVLKMQDGYKLNFISYNNAKEILYSKFEYDEHYNIINNINYRTLPFKHISNCEHKKCAKEPLITYHLVGNEIFIKSHSSIYSEDEDKILAHVEMSFNLGKEYFKDISKDLNMQIETSIDKKYEPYAHNLLDKNSIEEIKILQNEEDYYSIFSINTQDTKVYITTTLNKSTIKSILNENRKKLILFLIFITILILVTFRYLFTKGLAIPLENLMKQVNKIENGDYSKSEVVDTHDELEQISKNVNQLAQTIKDRESALQESQKNLEYLSTHDPLTNLPNRRLYMIRLEDSLKRAKRSKTKVAVLFIDLDQFKHINDTLGHNIGDELLNRVSKRLRLTVRDSDTIARIGGDEFNILLENIKNIQDIEVIMNKLLADFKNTFVCQGHEISITASIGVAIYPDDGLDSDTLIKNADLAMYKAKDKGRNIYSFFSTKLSDYLEQRTEMIGALKSAVKSGDEFFLLYQPKISVKTQKIVSVEALIRWNSPKLGFVLPDQFIQIAEESNMIIPIGRWVLERACRDYVKLQDAGYKLDQISINVSSVQLTHSNMIKTLKEVIKLTHIDPKNIELEITESYIATNENNAIKTLEMFRNMGIDLAIDDFGTGYSSMSYLQKLPVTRLKIDKSFIDNLYSLQGSSAIVKAIIILAKTFNLKITAEGVETQEQVGFLKEEQCDEIQGYFYSKPLSLEDLKSFYKRQVNFDGI